MRGELDGGPLSAQAGHAAALTGISEKAIRAQTLLGDDGWIFARPFWIRGSNIGFAARATRAASPKWRASTGAMFYD